MTIITGQRQRTGFLLLSHHLTFTSTSSFHFSLFAFGFAYRLHLPSSANWLVISSLQSTQFSSFLRPRSYIRQAAGSSLPTAVVGVPLSLQLAAVSGAGATRTVGGDAFLLVQKMTEDTWTETAGEDSRGESKRHQGLYQPLYISLPRLLGKAARDRFNLLTISKPWKNGYLRTPLLRTKFPRSAIQRSNLVSIAN